jgi:hypothetical protein
MAKAQFMVTPKKGTHFVDLFNHKELEPVKMQEGYFISLEMDEQESACVGQFTEIISLERKDNRIIVKLADKHSGTSLKLLGCRGAEEVLLDTFPVKAKPMEIRLSNYARNKVEKMMLQLFDSHGFLVDEIILSDVR